MSVLTKPILEFAERSAARVFGKKWGDLAGRLALESGGHAMRRQGQAANMLVDMLERVGNKNAAEGAQFLEKNWADVEYLGPKFRAGDLSFYERLSTGKPATDLQTEFLAAKYTDLQAAYRQSVIDARLAQGGTLRSIPPPVVGSYFPRKYDSDLFAGKALEASIEYMLKTGQAKTRAGARRILGQHRSLDPTLSAMHPNIERRRVLKLPHEHRKDPGVVFDYILDAINRKNEIEAFGVHGERLEMLLDVVESESGVAARSYAETLTSAFLGHHPAAYSSLMERQVVAFEVATKLGLSVLSNIFQPLNNTLVVGVMPVLKALTQSVRTPEEFQSFGLRSGAAFMQTFADMKRILGAERELLLAKPFRWSQFPRVESWNRVFSANIGRVAAEDALATLLRRPGNAHARGLLETLGVFDVDAALRRGSLTEQELFTAGKRLSDITQLPQTVLSLPPLWKLNPYVRVATLFKQYAFGQAKFFKDFVIKPALRDGNYKPFIYLGVLFPTVGEVAADLKELARRGTLEERPDWDRLPYDRLASNMAQVGSFGIITDVFTAITSGYPGVSAAFLTGPVVSDVADVMELPGKSLTVTERLLLGKIPTFGPILKEKLVPPERKKKKEGRLTEMIEELF